MDITLGILAHVDAGKTTLSEQLLLRCGALRQAGRVDRGDTLLDFDPVERERGITVFAAQAEMRRGDRVYHLIDTPGHADFSPEMERALSVLDCAVLVVSAADGVQAHTETIWHLLRERGLPAVIFINKTDLPGADTGKTLRQIRERLSGDVYLMDSGFDGEALEGLAAADEEAMEAYLDGTLTGDTLAGAARRAFSAGAFTPAYSGSALGGVGVEELLRGLDLFCETRYDPSAPFSGRVYKITRDPKGARTALFKVLSGTVRAKDAVGDGKIHELRIYRGDKFVTVQEAAAGSLCGAVGLDGVKCGDGLGTLTGNVSGSFAPLITADVEIQDGAPARRVLEALRILEDEEPCLKIRWNGRSETISAAVMGEMELDVIRETTRRRFGLHIGFGGCSVVYMETISGSVRGYGHFEPLRHYAEVHLLIEEAPRGSGVTFASACPTDDLAANWQNLIRTHVLEREHPGPLTGSPLTDVKITLLSGRAHLKHTEGGDFREATYRAIRQGLFKAKCRLLEPVYGFEARTPAALIGRVISDVQRMSGSTEAPETLGDTALVTGRCPVSEMASYAREFAAFTRGAGRLSLWFGGFQECHDEDAVIERTGYDRERDAENPAGSVFCSHGAGHLVPWDEAEAHMHLPL